MPKRNLLLEIVNWVKQTPVDQKKILTIIHKNYAKDYHRLFNLFYHAYLNQHQITDLFLSSRLQVYLKKNYQVKINNLDFYRSEIAHRIALAFYQQNCLKKISNQKLKQRFDAYRKSDQLEKHLALAMSSDDFQGLQFIAPNSNQLKELLKTNHPHPQASY